MKQNKNCVDLFCNGDICGNLRNNFHVISNCTQFAHLVEIMSHDPASDLECADSRCSCVFVH